MPTQSPSQENPLHVFLEASKGVSDMFPNKLTSTGHDNDHPPPPNEPPGFLAGHLWPCAAPAVAPLLRQTWCPMGFQACVELCLHPTASYFSPGLQQLHFEPHLLPTLQGPSPNPSLGFSLQANTCKERLGISVQTWLNLPSDWKSFPWEYNLDLRTKITKMPVAL